MTKKSSGLPNVQSNDVLYANLPLHSSKKPEEIEWDMLLSIYSLLTVVGRIVARQRIKEIQRKLNGV